MAKTKLKNKFVSKFTKTKLSKKKMYHLDDETNETVGVPGLIQPSEYDLQDELSRLDSFSYGRYNE